MGVQLNISYETLVDLVEQLPEDQQRDLMQRLQDRTQGREMTLDDKIALLRSAQIDRDVKEEPSPRREDWYDDER